MPKTVEEKTIACPMCGLTHEVQLVQEEETIYEKDTSMKYTERHWHCDNRNADWLTAGLWRENQHRIIKAEKAVKHG